MPGVELTLAANHWDVAVSTHQVNFPAAAHDLADLSQVNPRRYPRSTIAWMSPECTNHSRSKGVPRSDDRPGLFDVDATEAARSRATMWDVLRFTEYHRYDIVLVENVVEVAKWTLYDDWLGSMRKLGYRHCEVYIDASHLPGGRTGKVAQGRGRLYVGFSRLGNPAPDFELRPISTCSTHGRVEAAQAWKSATRWGKYKQQYVYRCPQVACRHAEVEPETVPASTVIDWSTRGSVIGERSRPLSPATRARIDRGMSKHPDQPLLLPYYGQSKAGLPLSRPLGTLTTRDRYALLDVIPGRPVEDARLRMLTVAEQQAGMGIPASYRLTGTREQRVMQLGNGVVPAAAEWLVTRAVESLGAGS